MDTSMFDLLEGFPLLQKVILFVAIYLVSRREVRKQFLTITTEMKTTNTNLESLNTTVKSIGEHMQNLDKRVAVLEYKVKP